MDIIHSLIIQEKEKKKTSKEERWTKDKCLGYFSISFHMCKGKRLGFCCYKIELGEITERRLKKGLLGYPQALEEEETQAKIKGSLGRPRFAHMCGGNSCCRGRKFRSCSRGRNFVVGGRSCAARRNLTRIELDKGSTSSGRSDLVLEGYWSWSTGLGIHQLKNL